MFRKNSADAAPDASSRLRLILILAGGLLGVLLLLLANGRLFAKEPQETDSEAEVTAEAQIEAYQLYIEERIRRLCESVDGVSGVTVAVTLSGNFEDIYATEQKDGDEKYVIVGSGANASALYLSQVPPEIIGIGVVCHGGGSSDIRRELTSLISAAFDISSNRIYIAEAKS